ncbi:uncharacterized protein CLAFUR5_14633 [Fulvia fulva]|uniref:Uncharacterized protein n=1 Tax=Passalora fulva TaxID=5499 RepID=A0A9Q8UX28_PASFU|nr:uncharacterized protein CLAFUR5_14633 [Fulvia fulva]KAK4608892.1 hypothetical protein CLAFUR0_14843 [Fulvia fulva]UJO25407.1 hypothetical protein CLAFUR5_14633 [Fulvia fulva]
MGFLAIFGTLFAALLIIAAIWSPDVIGLPPNNPLHPLPKFILGGIGFLILFASLSGSPLTGSGDPTRDLPSTTRAPLPTSTTTAPKGKSEEEIHWTVCVNEATGAMSTCLVSKEEATYYPRPLPRIIREFDE